MCTIPTYLFIFISSGAPHDFHSFPTRRSSDLSVATVRTWFRPHAPAPTTPSFRRLDRKSTRLNSSHTVISYAVFCLKKKINLYCHVRSYEQDMVLKHNYHCSYMT